MEKNKFSYQIIEGLPSAETTKILLTLYTTVFEDAKPNFFIERLHQKENLISIIAFNNNTPVGFKIGYHYNETTFYSWVGGVMPLYRKHGVATQLALQQENRVKDKGYIKIRTKSMNRFKPMLILNIKNGFDIVNVYTNEKKQTKIVFEKKL